MAKVYCNPECACCGKQVKEEDKVVIYGNVLHEQCSEEWRLSQGIIIIPE